MRRRALSKRYGRAGYSGPLTVLESGHVKVIVRLDDARGVWRGELSWPEIDENGRISHTLKHHLIKTCPTHTKSGAQITAGGAARWMLKTSGLAGTPVHPEEVLW